MNKKYWDKWDKEVGQGNKYKGHATNYTCCVQFVHCRENSNNSCIIVSVAWYTWASVQTLWVMVWKWNMRKKYPSHADDAVFFIVIMFNGWGPLKRRPPPPLAAAYATGPQDVWGWPACLTSGVVPPLWRHSQSSTCQWGRCCPACHSRTQWSPPGLSAHAEKGKPQSEQAEGEIGQSLILLWSFWGCRVYICWFTSLYQKVKVMHLSTTVHD